jgi:heme ABC exporter ATP-binding subunit CcmA
VEEDRHHVLEARSLSAVRGNRTVFQGVNLGLSPGEIVALVGGNGVGKTTLLHCLTGVLRPSGGEILWQGKPCRRSPAARRLVGLVGHESGLYPALTVRENLFFAARMWHLDNPEERVADLLGKIELEGRAAQMTEQLSRGLRQRLALSRALIHDPAVVLLDEPYTSLDNDGQRWLTDFLGELRKRSRAVLLTTHQPGDFRIDRLVHLGPDGLREMELRPVQDCVA